MYSSPFVVIASLLLPPLAAQQRAALQHTSTPPVYHTYAGNTHSHTAYTWSHGDQFTRGECKGIRVYGARSPTDVLRTWSDGYVKSDTGCYTMYVINGFQIPSPDMKLKTVWQRFQGPPSVHFAIAKKAGYAFYVTSDHSQEDAFSPTSATNPSWVESKKEANMATDAGFVAIAGFEFSENDGPGGTGHINVLNTEGIVNALATGVDLPYFYKWLETAKPNGAGPIVASFNHPDAHQYADFGGRTTAATDIITMLEVINSNKNIHYEGFLAALDHGWKVSPVAGNDNHGLEGITKQKSRTFVLATAQTRAAILDAMKHRRTYASLDNNIQCRYTVNGEMMGSTLTRSGSYKFVVNISDPDANDPKDVITKVDIVKDGGEVAQSFTPPNPTHSVEWKPVVSDPSATYFFVRIWNAGGGDVPNGDPEKPIAWLAPVWTAR